MAEYRKSGGFKSNRGGGGGFKPRGDRPSFGGARSYGGDQPQHFDAICADCGKPCRVPFKPNGVKPVYCRDCFANKREGGPIHESYNRETPRVHERTFARMPEQVLAPDTTKEIEELKRNLEAAHTKLNTIIKMVEGLALAEPLSVVVEAPAKKAGKSRAKK